MNKPNPPLPRSNVDLVGAFFAALNAGDFDAAAAVVGDDFVNHRAGTRGREAFLASMKTMATSLEGLRFDLADCFGDGDKVCVRFVAHGRWVGPLFGQPPTHKQSVQHGQAVYRVVDGRLVESWNVSLPRVDA